MEIEDIKKIDTKHMYETYDNWPQIAKDASERVFEKCRPRPEEAPVMRATFPLKSKILVAIV